MNNYLVTPDSDIYLLKCPLEMDSKHQLDFSSATNQHNYFNGLTKVLMDDATYQRRDDRLYFEGDYDTLLTYNYCMYRNTNYSSKWFYAFVTDMRYENNNVVSCGLSTDVYQTWMFDFTLKKSFIERSHVAKSGDTIGAYTVPENLETGEYKIASETDKIYFQNDGTEDTTGWNINIVVGSTYDLEHDSNWAVGNMYTGVYSGVPYYWWNLTNYANLATKLTALSQEVAQNSIQSLFLAPDFIVEKYTTAPIPCDVKSGQNPKMRDYKVPVFTSIDGYTPKNKKCFIFPYTYLDVTNGNGGNAIYHIEKFYNTSWSGYYTFTMYGVLVPGGSIRIMPRFYNGIEFNNDEGLTLGKYPQLSWTTDLYTNWLTQNGVNIGVATTGGILKTAVGAASMLTPETAMLGASTLTSGISDIGNTLGAIYEHSLTPPQAEGNLNGGDVTTTIGFNKFRIKTITIKQEFAKIIDNYFEFFGYKLNEFAVPNTTSRTKWNYIKTMNVDMTGDIPENDLQKLKDLYNGGFTIWHDTSHFMDYTQTNS